MNVKQGAAGRRLRVPSPAMVVACISLAVALSGASYAAISIPRNSVGTPQLKRDAVTSAKVRNGAITGADVNEATLARVPSSADADKVGGLTKDAFALKEHVFYGFATTFARAPGPDPTSFANVYGRGETPPVIGALLLTCTASEAGLAYANTSESYQDVWNDHNNPLPAGPRETIASTLPPHSATGYIPLASAGAAHVTFLIHQVGIAYVRVEAMLRRDAAGNCKVAIDETRVS